MFKKIFNSTTSGFDWKIAILLFGIFAFLGLIFFYLGGYFNIGGETLSPARSGEKKIQVFSLAAVISGIDIDGNSIVVRSPIDGKDIRVDLNKNSEIIRLDFPFDPKNHPKDISFSPQMTKIALSDLRVGNQALIETGENIYQKSQFDAVKRIQILP